MHVDFSPSLQRIQLCMFQKCVYPQGRAFKSEQLLLHLGSLVAVLKFSWLSAFRQQHLGQAKHYQWNLSRSHVESML